MNAADAVDYSTPLNIEELPEGMKAFIKERRIPPGTSFVAYLYRITKLP